MKNNTAKRTVLPFRDIKVKREIMFHGIPASPGIVYGTVMLLKNNSVEVVSAEKVQNISSGQVQEEIKRFEKALQETQEEIKVLRDRVQSSLKAHEANIFDAHFLIVQDKSLMNQVTGAITEKYIPADAAFSQVMQKYITAMSAVEDPYLKERAMDIKDVAGRVLSHLHGLEIQQQKHSSEPQIIVAKDLTPSDTAMLDPAHVLAFAIESGSKTSHSAILARSMKIPAIVGMNRFVQSIEDGDRMIVDGFLGIAILNPTEATVELYKEKEKTKARLMAELMRETRLRSETTDGYTIQLAANVESGEHPEELKQYGAAGVGLFRTEYLFMNREQMPTEEEQFAVYRKVAENLNGEAVIIRTLDIGGDKLAAAMGPVHEQNPFLGLRAIRLCLANPQLLQTQMRAILRAGVYGNIKMMFPMISSINELNQALDILEKVKSDLQNANMRFDGDMEIGVMIEIPAAALIAEQLAKKVDFFSIGTNDLVQYTLAVDRNNEKVSKLYEPTHPAVLQLIAMTTRAAARNGIWTGVCGEMAGDPRYTPILLGLGIVELSMPPMVIGHIRRLIRKISMHEAEKIAEKALHAETAAEALRYSMDFLENNMPEILAGAREG